MTRVLVLAPHADDEVLGCGGTMARHINDGHHVSICVLTNASVGSPELFSAEQIVSIRDEAKQAHKVLGVSDTYFLELPAPQLEQYPQYKIAQAIGKVIKESGAELLYVPHRGDLHMDHGAVYNAALVAARPLAGQTVKKILAYETLSETEWGHPTPDAAFIPTVFSPFEKAEMQAKLTAMACFASQVKPPPHSRSLEAIESLAKLRGATVSHHFAEAFMLIREIN